MVAIEQGGQVQGAIDWRLLADGLVALGTLVLAAVAVFQETIRSWFYKPKFRVSIKTEPPDCVAVPFTDHKGTFIANAVYFRIWIENTGNATAKNVEVYAAELRRMRLDKKWESVHRFPPMNLVWANRGGEIYFPTISPNMGKHCDLGHITEPPGRNLLGEGIQGVANTQTTLVFELQAKPNHQGHIVPPGEYEVDVLIAAENAHPIKRTLAIKHSGIWYSDEATMLRDGVGISVVTHQF